MATQGQGQGKLAYPILWIKGAPQTPGLFILNLSPVLKSLTEARSALEASAGIVVLVWVVMSCAR